MSIPLAAIPMALSAIRSLIHLRHRIVDIRDTRRSRDPLKLLLPELPHNLIRDQQNDPALMQNAFSQIAHFRAALDARDILEHFDLFHKNIDWKTGGPLEPERHSDMFWRFMGFYYKLEDEDKKIDGIPDFEIDEHGLDSFLVKSAKSGGGQEAVNILRATAEILINFLGDNAGVFLAKSPNKLILSTVLREFATATDIETDNSNRILKTLVGAIAVGAADHGATLSNKPAAALLIAALGRTRRDFGDDFLARIVSHQGFSAVMADWVKSLATDPYLVELLAEMQGLDESSYDPSDAASLPAKLQPVFGALQNVLGVVSDHIGTRDALAREETFRAVFGAVLNGVTNHSSALLKAELEGDKFMATLLETVIAKIGRTGAIQNDDLIAPVFENLLDTLAGVIPELGQDVALNRAELILEDFAQRLESGEIQTALDDLKAFGGEQFARDLMVELFGKAQIRLNAQLEGDASRSNIAAQILLAQMPELLENGLNRDGAVRVFEAALGQILKDETPEGSLVRDLLPMASDLLNQLRQDRPQLDKDTVETFVLSWINKVRQDRPVWQALHRAELLKPVITGIGTVLSSGAMPRDISMEILLEVAHSATATLFRHGIILQELAETANDPGVFLNTKIIELVDQAASAAVGQLGRSAGGADLVQIFAILLDTALSGNSMELMTSAQIDTALERALALRL